MTFTISSIDEYNCLYPVTEVETLQEASELLEEIDIAMDTASGSRYYELQSQYNELREQIIMT